MSYFALGIIFLFGAVLSMCTGKTLARSSRGVIRRDEDPREFWGIVAIYYLFALLFFYCHL